MDRYFPLCCEELLNRKKRFYCKHLYLGPKYIIGMAIFGIILMTIDLLRILRNNSQLPENLRSNRMTSGAIVTSRLERDLRLVACVIGIKCFSLLIYGIVTEDSVLLYPWLVTQSIMISVELLVYLSNFRNFFKPKLYKQLLFTTPFAILNWIQVFCHLREHMFSF